MGAVVVPILIQSWSAGGRNLEGHTGTEAELERVRDHDARLGVNKQDKIDH